MNIIKNQILYNRSRRTEKPQYIVIHDTGNTARGADARRNFEYFNSGNRGASADFFVDDKEIYQVNDYNIYYTWHCGDGGGKYGITNGNSVGIEICINADGDYNRAFENAAELTKQLMAELNISPEKVVRHYDASRKNCPATMRPNDWARWYDFKRKLTEGGGMMSNEYDELNGRLAKVENPMIYNYMDENMPEWAKPTVQKLMDKGALKGNERGELGLTEEFLRVLVINDRMGVYGE